MSSININDSDIISPTVTLNNVASGWYEVEHSNGSKYLAIKQGYKVLFLWKSNYENKIETYIETHDKSLESYTVTKTLPKNTNINIIL